MPTNKQRREAARRHLERQLERRQEREARRKKVVLIASVLGAVVLIGVVIGIVVGFGGGNGKSKPQARGKHHTPASSSPTSSPAPTTSAPSTVASKPCPKAAHGAKAVLFDCVTVGNATDLAKAPTVGSGTKTKPTKLAYKDLVVGKGRAATMKSSVTVQYVGVLYQNGTQFDSSWSRGQPATFSLAPGSVIPGFSEGIGGTKGVPPMRIGGRRIIIVPSSLGYGPQGKSSIPPDSPLVFVVDLKQVKG